MLTPIEFNARCEALAEEISASTGCAPRIASIAASAYLSFSHDYAYGLGDPGRGLAFDYSDARHAIRVWLANVEAASLKKAA